MTGQGVAVNGKDGGCVSGIVCGGAPLVGARSRGVRDAIVGDHKGRPYIAARGASAVSCRSSSGKRSAPADARVTFITAGGTSLT
jgi:hypothetical protein